jgi:L-ascorbate metabolism protein UlaG (beta-lactamase superfamily)
MDIEFFGANCVRLKTKEAVITIDDNLSKIGGKTVVDGSSVLMYTNRLLVDENANEKARLLIDTAGEFEVGDVTVRGEQTRSHLDEDGTESATVLQFMMNNQTVTVLGHVHPDLSKAVVELIGGTDVLVIPVGGNGYTLDGVAATSIIKKAEPAVVVPTYYEDNTLTYEVPAQPLSEFLKISSLQSEEPIDMLRLGKNLDIESTQTKIVLLNRKK